MQRNIKWDTEIEKVKQLELDGYNQTDIAAHFGVSRQMISQVFRKYGLERVGIVVKQNKAREARLIKYGDKEDPLWNEQRRRYTRKKQNCKKTKWGFSVAFGEIEWSTTCPILGIPLDYFAIKTQENSPSFDRVDPSLGYIKGNVIICSWRANRIKNDGNAEEHRLISEYLTKRG